MAAGDVTITVIGNLTDDPELRFTPSGAAVAKFRVASTPRFLDRQTNEWKDGEPLFLSCNVWRQAAENVAESLQRGARVIVSGRLRQRSYETREGEKRTVMELEVDEIGPSLRYATAKVQKMSRSFRRWRLRLRLRRRRWRRRRRWQRPTTRGPAPRRPGGGSGGGSARTSTKSPRSRTSRSRSRRSKTWPRLRHCASRRRR